MVKKRANKPKATTRALVRKESTVPAKIPERIPTPATLALAAEMRKLGGPEPMKQFLSNLPSRTLDLSAAPLQGLLMSGVNLQGATLIQVAFNGSDLTGSDLRGTFAPRFGGLNGRFLGVNFTGSDLREAVFTGADLRGTRFTLCDLRNAIFTGANIDGAIFSGANLTGAYMTGVLNFRRAVFEYAILNGTLFSPGVEEIVLEMTIPSTPSS